MRRFVCVLTVLFGIALVAGNAQANMITNGDFSDNAAAFTTNYGYGNGFPTASTNPKGPTGWTFFDTNGTTWIVRAGVNGDDTGGGTPINTYGPTDRTGVRDYMFLQRMGKAYQDFAIAPSQQYELDLNVGAIAPGTTAGYASIYITDKADSGIIYLGIPTFGVTGASFQAKTYTFTTPGTVSGTATLTFFNTSDAGGVVDYANVNLFATPEPSTFLLACTGLIGLLAYAWRRRR